MNRLRKSRNCVVWTRVSTAKQEKNGGSLDYQKELCVKYAREQGLNVVWQDDAKQEPFGGTHESAKVPGDLFKAMIKRVKKDTSISKILCSEFDRFSRDAAQAIGIIRELYDLGVVVCSVKQGIQTDNKDKIMMAAMILNLANWDNDKRADKFYAGRKHCYESGAYTGVLPRGYYREGKSLGSVCKLNDDGLKIRKAFRWKLDGHTNAEIIEMLKKIGFETTKQSLNHYFNNPFYAGKIQSTMLEGGMVDGKIEKAVSYEDWLRVQKIMSDKAAWYKHKKKNETFPLKNFVRCGECGTHFTAYTVCSKHCDYYKCNKIGCKTNVSATKMHEEFVHVLQDLDLPVEFYKEYESVLHSLLSENDKNRMEHVTLLKKQRTEKQKEIDLCKMRYAVGKIESDVYEEARAKMESELAKIDAELENYSEKLSNLEREVGDIIVSCSKLSDLWKESDLETRQRIQKLTFPKGIFWDKEKKRYRTENRNSIFDVFDCISVSYGHKKETDSEEPVSSCAG